MEMEVVSNQELAEYFERLTGTAGQRERPGVLHPRRGCGVFAHRYNETRRAHEDRGNSTRQTGQRPEGHGTPPEERLGRLRRKAP